MVRAFKNEDELAYVTRFNRETEEKEDFVISAEPYTGVSWTSKDERVLATVHTSHIRVFSIPSLEEIYAVPTNSMVKYGCLSFDGQFLAFRVGDDYHVHCISSQSLISNVTFTKGSKCWVNSEALFIKEAEAELIHKFAHGEIEAILTIEGEIAAEQDNGEIFFLRDVTVDSKRYFRLIDANNEVKQDFEKRVSFAKRIISCDISSKYVVIGDDHLYLYDRRNRATIKRSRERRVQSVYISPDEKHFILKSTCRTSNVYDIAGKNVTNVPSMCTGPSVTYSVFKDLIVCKTPLGSLLCYCGSIIPCDSILHVEPYKCGYLVFFSSKVAFLDEFTWVFEDYELNNATIVRVTEDRVEPGEQEDEHRVFNVELDDGTFMYVGLKSKDLMLQGIQCSKDRNCINFDDEIEIRIADLKKREELRLETDENALEISMKMKNLLMSISMLEEEDKKLEEKDKKLEEMDKKLQVAWAALDHYVPASVKEEYSTLLTNADKCASALHELDVSPESFFNFSLTPEEITIKQSICELEKAMGFVKKIDGIVQEFELSDTLSSTFATRFSDMAEQHLAFKVLYEQEYAGKLEELQKLDVYFDIYRQCRDFAQTEMYSAFKGFMDKFSEFNDIFGREDESS
ncbi:hypothetical protein PCE1_001969 [Barthelona sp. PCE]